MKKILRWAARNVVRIPGRSLIIGAIMLVVSALVMAGLSIQAGTRASIAQAKQSLGSTATLQLNMQNFRQQRDQQSGTLTAPVDFQRGVPISEAEKLLASPFVIGYNYSNSAQASADISPVVDTTASATASAGGGMFGGQGGDFSISIPDFSIVGGLSAALSSNFYSGTRTLTDGRFYTQEEVDSGAMVALISRDLADLNGLSAGSTFTITPQEIRLGGRDFPNAAATATPTASPDASASTTDSTAAASYTVTVVGIFTDASQSDLSGQFRMLNPANSLEMPYTAVQILSGSTDTTRVSNVTYYLDDPANLQAFADSAASLGVDTTTYTVNINDTAFQRMTSSLTSVSNMAGIMIIVVIVAGILIMALLMGMSVRERKAEIGILRAIGTKRGWIAAQFVTEAVLVCVVAMLMGGTVGAVSSQAVSKAMLSSATSSTTTQQSQFGSRGGMGGPGMGGPGEMFTQQIAGGGNVIRTIDTRVGVPEILLVLGVGLFVCFAGSGVAIYRIMKYEPMQILANRV